jgi:hypothetical protein
MQAEAARASGTTAWAASVLAALMISAAGTAVLQTRAPTIVVILGPAEAANTGRPNPGLSAAGLARARELVRVIGDLPANAQVAAVFATRYRDSQETAEPIARHLNLPVQLVDSADREQLLRRIGADYRGQLLVVVTDGKAMPALISGLLSGAVSAAEPMPGPDRIYVVTMPRIGAGRALALRYGAPVIEVAGS